MGFTCTVYGVQMFKIGSVFLIEVMTVVSAAPIEGALPIPIRRILTPWIFISSTYGLPLNGQVFGVACRSILLPNSNRWRCMEFTVLCLDLTHPSSEINKSPAPGIDRGLVWFAIDP